MFTDDIPTYVIDLSNDESQRWVEVIVNEQAIATRVVQEASAVIERLPEFLRGLFARVYRTSGGLYNREITAWAEGLGVSVGTATMLNCVYELSHLRWSKVFGCTAGVRWVEGIGMVHFRNLDWPLATMGPATRLFRFRRGQREFVSIGVPGHVAVLSGMLPYAYSVTINWAPPAAFPSFDFGPAFLLRDTLETCDSYGAAVERLTRTRLSTSVFFTVCGTQRDEACVIERTQNEAAVRTLTGPALVQTNHHIARRFVKHNKELLVVVEGEEEFSLDGSNERADKLLAELISATPACAVDVAADVLNAPAVLNKFTCQQIVFCPQSGEARVRRRIADPHGECGSVQFN